MPNSESQDNKVSRKKKSYVAPRLVVYGKLQELTKGAAGKPGDGGGTTKAPCWIAEALYGAADIRTHLLRAWLVTDYAKSPFGAAVVGAYGRLGRPVAAITRRSRLVQRIWRPLFDRGVSAAQRQFMQQ